MGGSAGCDGREPSRPGQRGGEAEQDTAGRRGRKIGANAGCWRAGLRSGCASGYKARVAGRHADTYEKTLPMTPIVVVAGGRSRMPVTKKPPYGGLSNLAERGGFEPPRRYKRLPDFESGTFNRSATSPDFPGQRAAAGGAMIRAAGSADKARAVHCRPFFQS